jgi:ABC-2 type transport system ATP-binding protein
VSEVVLKTENVKKMIGRKTIVSDISLELYRGEIFGFLGPNGAGKTTTIKMIVGLSSITQGEIYVGGCSVRKDFRGAMRNIGCIVENPDMYGYMSGLDNLRLFARMYKGIGEKRIAEVVDTVGLSFAINNKVKTYSLGMKQRLGIAQALLHKPELLVLDEPTNGLDPAGIHEMRGLLRELAEDTGMTVFVSSHILSEMQQMCDRVGIINNGRIVTVKSVGELISMAQQDGGDVNIETDNLVQAAAIIGTAGLRAVQTQEGLKVEAPRDKVPSIVASLVNAGIGVYGVSIGAQNSLEEIFMKLTGEDPAAKR